jgi:hypothetical protein
MLKINQCISIVWQEGYCESTNVNQLHDFIHTVSMCYWYDMWKSVFII